MQNKARFISFLFTPHLCKGLNLFVAFNNIESHQVASKPIPAEFEVAGFYFKYEKHVVYWKYLENSDIGAVTVLHEKMHQIKHSSQTFWQK